MCSYMVGGATKLWYGGTWCRKLRGWRLEKQCGSRAIVADWKIKPQALLYNLDGYNKDFVGVLDPEDPGPGNPQIAELKPQISRADGVSKLSFNLPYTTQCGQRNALAVCLGEQTTFIAAHGAGDQCATPHHALSTRLARPQPPPPGRQWRRQRLVTACRWKAAHPEHHMHSFKIGIHPRDYEHDSLLFEGYQVKQARPNKGRLRQDCTQSGCAFKPTRRFSRLFFLTSLPVERLARLSSEAPPPEVCGLREV